MSVRLSSLRARLDDGRLVGTFIKLPALESLEIVAAELDFAVVDLEHSQLTEGQALRLVRHAHALGFPTVVRIPEVERALVNRLLEAGTAGLQLSSVRRTSELAALRAAASYPPHGSRSISLAHPLAGYGAAPLEQYVQGLERPLLVAQLETMETEDPLDDLVHGADVVFLGVTDLLVDAGLDRERAHTRADEIAEAVQGAGVHLGGFGADERFRYAVISSDVALLREAVAGVR